MGDFPVDNALGDQIHGVGVNNRSADDAFLTESVHLGAGEIGSAGRYTPVGQADLPQLRSRVGVEGVGGIRLGHDVDNVVRALTGNGDLRHVEGLGQSLIVDGSAKEMAKVVAIDVEGRQ